MHTQGGGGGGGGGGDGDGVDGGGGEVYNFRAGSEMRDLPRGRVP